MAEDTLHLPDETEPDGAEIHLEVEGVVTLTCMQRLVESWSDFLVEIGKGVTGNQSRDAVRYLITTASGGSFSLGVRPEPGDTSAPVSKILQIARTVTSGISELSQESKRPKHFSDKALVRLREMVGALGADMPSFKVSDRKGHSVVLSTGILLRVNEVLAHQPKTFGTIEGKLVGLDIHGKKKFFIYDKLRRRRVTCYFGDAISWKELVDILGKRISATGRIQSHPLGGQRAINVSSYYVFPSEDELPSIYEVLGLLK